MYDLCFWRICITINNEWKQLWGRYNWISVTPVSLRFTVDKEFPGFEIEAVLLGFYICIRYNTPAGEIKLAELERDAV